MIYHRYITYTVYTYGLCTFLKQNLTALADINAMEMEDENKESDVIIPVPDSNSTTTIQYINSDHDISGKLYYLYFI